jgi:hypothetical protein
MLVKLIAINNFIKFNIKRRRINIINMYYHPGQFLILVMIQERFFLKFCKQILKHLIVFSKKTNVNNITPLKLLQHIILIHLKKKK